MEDIVQELVASYGANVMQHQDDDDLLIELRRRLDEIIASRNEPFPMKLYTLAVLRAHQIIREVR